MVVNGFYPGETQWIQYWQLNLIPPLHTLGKNIAHYLLIVAGGAPLYNDPLMDLDMNGIPPQI
jgi:hypothetical protein